MSAGNFDSEGKYEADNGLIYKCRPQPETKDLSFSGDGGANTYPAGSTDEGVGSIKLSKGRRELGVVPRRVRVKWTAAPTGEIADYGGIGSQFIVPVFDPDKFSAYQEGSTGTYLGVACRLEKKYIELVN